MQRKLTNGFSTGKGAAIVEAAITLPVFVLLTYGLLELARYFFVTIWISYVAFTVVDDLSKFNEIPTFIDSSNCSLDSKKCDDFKEGIAKIINEAETRLSALGKSIEYNEFKLFTGNKYEIVSRIGFIRPGEKIQLIIKEESNENKTSSEKFLDYNHPTRGAGDCEPLLNRGLPCTQRGEKWSDVLRSNPLVVVIEAKFSFITPIISNKKFTITAMQMSLWRGMDESIGEMPPTLVPISTHTPEIEFTKTPTVTPTATATITHTTTVTATVTITASQTPTEIATVTPTITITPQSSPTMPIVSMQCIRSKDGTRCYDESSTSDQCETVRSFKQSCNARGGRLYMSRQIISSGMSCTVTRDEGQPGTSSCLCCRNNNCGAGVNCN